MSQEITWTVRRILQWTTEFFERKAVDSPRLSAELLLAHVLKVPRLKLYTDHDRLLLDPETTAYRELVRRSAEHEPIAYLTGKAHFFDLELDIRPGVLIPRPDTETLVETALNLCRHTAGLEAPRILDLCSGSGCIAAALAKHLPAAVIVAIDIDTVAVEVARGNFATLGIADRITLLQGDLYVPLCDAPDPSPFHLIVSNPPYICTADLPNLDRSVRDYEPRRALDGGPDGLCCHRRILQGAPERLLPGGAVMLEIAFDQAPAALALAGQFPCFTNPRILKDAGGNDRILALSLA